MPFYVVVFIFFQAEDGIRDGHVTGVQTCALPIFSPWLDISLGHKVIRKYEKKDPMLNVDNLRKIGGMWAGGSPPGSYQLSPMYGSFEGLGRISIFIGTREICFPDAAKLSHILNSEGIEHNYFEYNWMNHNFPLYPIKEGAASRAQIAELIR